jgi:hypothetical protein
MDARRWEAVRAAFDEVVELGKAERASRLAAISVTDAALREAVDFLLRAARRFQRCGPSLQSRDHAFGGRRWGAASIP